MPEAEEISDPVGNAVTEALLNGNGAELDRESGPAVPEVEEIKDPVGNAVIEALLKGNGAAVELTYVVEVFEKDSGPAEVTGDVPLPTGLLMVFGPAVALL